MAPHNLTLTLTLAGALSLMVGACSPRDNTDRTTSVGDTAAGAKSAGSRMATKTGEIRDLQGPEAARWDADQNVWFVDNINGEAGGKDNNGFISRIKADGTMDSLKFIAGGVRKVTLNAPKGMAIVGDTLWVADIDVVRAFNRRTGAPITTVTAAGAKFLNDAVASPDGTIYLTDTGVTPDFKHPGPDRIYQVKNRKASIALESSKLSGPNGITWAGDHFVIVPFLGTEIVSWKPGDKDVQVIGTGPGQHDGVEVLKDGSLLTTSWTDSSLFMLKDGQTTRVAYPVPSAADIGFDGESKVLVPLLMENRIEFWEMP